MTKIEYNILYITYDGITDPLGRSQILPYLIELSKSGYDISILSFEKKKIFHNSIHEVLALIDKTTIQWFPKYFTERPFILGKVYDKARMLFFAIILFKKKKFKVIHCRSYVAAEVGFRLKKKYGCSFLFDMRGFWPDEKVDSGRWDQNNYLFKLIYKRYKKIEIELLKNADTIITLTEKAKEYLIEMYPEYNNKITVIPCCADLIYFNYHSISISEKAKLRLQLGISNQQKVITYIGSTGGFYLTNEVFHFFKVLLNVYPEYYLLFLTKDDSNILRQQALAMDIPSKAYNIISATRIEVPKYLGITSISVFFIRPSFSKIASSPTRHAELMAMGIPVICNDIGDTGNILLKTKSGVLVESFNAEEYQKVIKKLPNLYKIPKESIRQSAYEYFDLAKGVRKYLNIYKCLFDNLHSKINN